MVTAVGITVLYPPPVLEDWEGYTVVRDDLIPGGTKARVLPLLFDGREEYVYPSPVQGYAQVALAYCCRAYGKRATVFCARRRDRHARTFEAMTAGASVHEIGPAGYLNVVRCRAKEYCYRTGACLLPWGLDTPVILNGLAGVARSMDVQPAEVWTVAGSGTLTRALQLAWPDARFFAVRVGSAPNAGRATVLTAPERYDDVAELPPPFPSCSNYDSKLWRFVRKYASPGALVWNVAG